MHGNTSLFLFAFRIQCCGSGFNLHIDTDNDIKLRKHMKNGGEQKLIGVSVFTMTINSAMNTKIRYSGTPAEYVVVNYEVRTVHPLVTSKVSFGMGDYLIDCRFEENGEIRLLAAFLPIRY